MPVILNRFPIFLYNMLYKGLRVLLRQAEGDKTREERRSRTLESCWRHAVVANGRDSALFLVGTYCCAFSFVCALDDLCLSRLEHRQNAAVAIMM